MRPPYHPEGWAEKLHVVTMISNPIDYHQRYHLFKAFETQMLQMGVVLWVVEVAYGEKSFVVTKSDNPQHLQLRVGSDHRKGAPIWLKEAAQELMVQRLPSNWKYVLFCDSDIVVQIPDWPERIIEQLQYHDVIQPWSHAQDLGPDGMPLNKKPETSFCYNWYEAEDKDKLNWDHTKYSGGVGHPGYCVAMRRDAYDKLGGLCSIAILGSGDRHLMYALVDKVEHSYHPNMHASYKHWLKTYQVRARHYIHRNIAYLPGLITHHWHGDKAGRQYSSRWQILVRNQFNPNLDLKKDSQGLITLTERNWRLRHDIMKYFEYRGEDGIDIL